MANDPDETQLLVDEADTLVDQAEAVEAAGPGTEGKKLLRALKNHYFDWEARAKELLSDELSAEFDEQFEGNALDKHRIRRYFSDALTPMNPDLLPRSFAAESPGMMASADREFEPYIEQQKRILYSARVKARRIPESAGHLDIYADMFRRLPQVVDRLSEPGYDAREGLAVNDEYDLQRVIYALLNSVADDVEPEEWGERSFGRNPRLDFMVRDNGTAVEVKFVRPSQSARAVGDEIAQDIPRYAAKSEVQSLLFVIYDPRRQVRNAPGLENSASAAVTVKPTRIVVAQ